MVRAGAGGFIVTTGTLVVLLPRFQHVSLELFNEELVFSSLARCLTYCEMCSFVVDWSMLFGSLWTIAAYY